MCIYDFYIINQNQMFQSLRWFLLFVSSLFSGFTFSQKATIGIWEEAFDNLPIRDWLVQPVKTNAAIYVSPDKKDLILYNGLVKRSFRLSPNAVCTEYKNMMNGQQILRAIKPEASLTLNGKEYKVGGLYGQKENAYLQPEWLDKFIAGENDFILEKYEVTELKPIINWKPGDWWASNTKQPSGQTISFNYKSTVQELSDIKVKVHYALYDGLPLDC